MRDCLRLLKNSNPAFLAGPGLPGKACGKPDLPARTKGLLLAEPPSPGFLWNDFPPLYQPSPSAWLGLLWAFRLPGPVTQGSPRACYGPSVGLPMACGNQGLAVCLS